MKKIVLYSQTFKGYVRLSNKLIGGKIIGLVINFTDNLKDATTFKSENDKIDFIKNYAIGVDYKFQTKVLNEVN